MLNNGSLMGLIVFGGFALLMAHGLWFEWIQGRAGAWFVFVISLGFIGIEVFRLCRSYVTDINIAMGNHDSYPDHPDLKQPEPMAKKHERQQEKGERRKEV